MNLTRRMFLKGVVAAVVSASTVNIAGATASDDIKIAETNNTDGFGLGKEYGNAVPLSDFKINDKRTIEKVEEIVKKVLINDARRAIGRNKVIEIRMKIPDEFGRQKALAWYTNDHILTMSPEITPKPVLLKEGYLYCGRIVT